MWREFLHVLEQFGAGGIAPDFSNLSMGILGNTDLALAKTTAP